MGAVIKLKRNATTGAIPTAVSLSSGEPVLNTGDNIIFVKMGSSIRAFSGDPIYEAKTTSFTATFGHIYDLHNTTDVDITLPTWVVGRKFEITLDGDAKNHALTFLYATGEPINGNSADVVVSAKDTGDVFTIRAIGTSSDKHWSIVRSISI